MLVLLIIFMLTAHVIARQAIEVDLPRASAAGAAPPTTLMITLTRDGELALNGQPATAAELTRAVQAAVASDPKAQAVIAGDRAVAHGRVVWVIDTIKNAGLTAFAIQIDPAAMVPP
ncbi:MAG: biopolymer transporter ExbD [Kofleriaceae bacterium]|nr:biopolymer transporter ExbD [Kofleriaceae bacterium]MBP9165791.1 biopolymer transporter ExbD [Kofleriaceae bacterium]MBP9857940.1 biopolymer transporter ExbD [Kofleriaceae bacterium]